MFGGKRMGGGTAGNIIRTAGKAVARAGAPAAANRPSSPTPSSRATHRHGGSTNFHALSSSSSSVTHGPVSATCGAAWDFCNPHYDGFEWIFEDGIEGENVDRVSEDAIRWWSVPSLDEVHGAVSAIHRVFGQENDEPGRVENYMGLVSRVSPVGSEVDWVEPRLELQLPGRGVERVYDAFHLLQTDPSVQKMVMSVASDKAVWEAIMNNEEVQHLRKSFYEDDTPRNSDESSSEEPSDEPTTSIVRWIFENTKTRVMEVIERITELMSQWFENGNDDKKRREGRWDVFEEKLRTSFLISIVVLLVVMVSRAHKPSQS